jgi:hypothetical protein
VPDPGNEFERLVADFSRRIWSPEAITVNRKIDGRELDILVQSGNEVVFIECTIERGKKKAQGDISKIRDFRKALLGDATHKVVSGFFVTQHDPSPEVHEVAKENGSWIEACSFPGFINKHNCSTSYILERPKSQFGSVRNPADDSPKLARNQYIEVPLRPVGSGKTLSVDKIVEDIVAKKQAVRIVLTGDFGIGKSMTFRELYFRLAEAYARGESYRFPMYINLKDGSFDEHDDAIDLIERHAKWVGLRAQRDKLVHAWRSDCCTIFLDGFDEVARSGFERLTTSSKNLRFASGHIVRQLVRQTDKNTSIFISGRESYFADFGEMRECLAADKFSHVSLHDLDETEVRRLYRKILPTGDPIVFGWLPQRPLLLSYLYFAFGEELRNVHENSSDISPGGAWHTLLDRLCARETEVARNAAPTQVRRLLDRVALYGRTNMAEPDRVTGLQLTQAYAEVFEMAPEPSVQQVLMRLPGLSTGGVTEDRGFIDDNFFEAAQAGTLVELIEALGTREARVLRSDRIKPIVELFRKTRAVITSLCAQVAVAALRQRNQLGVLGIALLEALANLDLAEGNTVGDLLMCALEQPQVGFRPELSAVNVKSAYFTQLEITKEAIGNNAISFRDCVIDRLELDVDESCLNQIQFEGTHVGRLTCSDELAQWLGKLGLTKEVDQIVSFDSTNSDILALHVSKNFKAVKIILRKLFREQRTAGRIKRTFFRGTGTLKRDILNRALLTLAKHKLIYVVGTPELDSSVWHANRAHSKRANALIDLGTTNDAVLSELELI